MEDQAVWEHQSDGLAIFAAPQLFRVYRLPLAFEELLVVDERPHITPLLPLFSDDGQFYVLALGLQGVQLLQGAHYSLRPIALPGVPTSLQDALGQPQWGTFDPVTGVLALHDAAEPHDSELLDLAAAQVILHGRNGLPGGAGAGCPSPRRWPRSSVSDCEAPWTSAKIEHSYAEGGSHASHLANPPRPTFARRAHGPCAAGRAAAGAVRASERAQD